MDLISVKVGGHGGFSLLHPVARVGDFDFVQFCVETILALRTYLRMVFLSMPVLRAISR